MDPRDNETYDIPEIESNLLCGVAKAEVTARAAQAASKGRDAHFMNPRFLSASIVHLNIALLAVTAAQQNLRERNAA